MERKIHTLTRLLQPQSIAVIGGGAWSANVIEQSRKIGFRGPIHAVHPTRDMAGAVTLRSVADLPNAPDAVFIGVNREATVKIVGQLAQMGAGGAVCFASGFAEASDQIDRADGLQGDLVEAAGDMPILGPNCYGYLNLLDGAALWPDQHGAVRVDRGVAIITQSSNIAINLTMQQRGLPLAYIVTAGNGAQTDACTIGAALLEDTRVTALGLHLEGIESPARLEALAAKARHVGKPIIALKVGRTQASQRAAVTHTASLAGGVAGSDALLARLRIARVEGLSEFIAALTMLHHTGPLPSRRIATMSCSGGEAGLVADAAARHGLVFPDLSPLKTDSLKRVLGPHVALANPLDYHTNIWGDRAAMADTFAAMLEGDVSIGAVILDFPRRDRCDPGAWMPTLDAAADASTRTGKPLAILSSLPDTMDEQMSAQIAAKGLIPLSGLEGGLAAIAAAATVNTSCVDGAPIAVLPPHRPKNARTLTEDEAKTALAKFGVQVPMSECANTPEDAKQAAHAIGYPVALKGIGVAHKTEAGAIRLGLVSGDEVLDAALRMPTSKFLVEEMVGDGVAELLIGVTLDPAHGYVLTLGAGGILAELLKDTASLLIPATRAEVDMALSQLRIARVLDGWRGGAVSNRSAILDAVDAVQRFVIAHHGLIEEVEINPLICRANDAIAVDALIRMDHPMEDT